MTCGHPWSRTDRNPNRGFDEQNSHLYTNDNTGPAVVYYIINGRYETGLSSDPNPNGRKGAPYHGSFTLYWDTEVRCHNERHFVGNTCTHLECGKYYDLWFYGGRCVDDNPNISPRERQVLCDGEDDDYYSQGEPAGDGKGFPTCVLGPDLRPTNAPTAAPTAPTAAPTANTTEFSTFELFAIAYGGLAATSSILFVIWQIFYNPEKPQSITDCLDGEKEELEF